MAFSDHNGVCTKLHFAGTGPGKLGVSASVCGHTHLSEWLSPTWWMNATSLKSLMGSGSAPLP